MTFDDPPHGRQEPPPWSAGCFPDSATPRDEGCIAAKSGGALTRVERPTGEGTSPAVQFPAPDAGRAVIQIPHAAHLDPGDADFAVSVRARLTKAEVSNANVVQKGFYGTSGGQWKLQIDDGVPNCRISGVRGGRSASAMVSWGRSVTDSGWAFIRCERRASDLRLSVDGATPVTSPDNARMTISNTAKVTVGGKGPGVSNDQFHGAVDNVVLRVG